jgi:predicted AAA+ superfamily ATPase
VPDIFVAIKAAIDRDRRPGRFLLTGSANVLVVPKLAESLVGRVEIHTLWPFSQDEIDRAPARFVDAVFDDKLPPCAPAGETREALLRRVLQGGYPQVVSRTTDVRRRAWFEAYVAAILQRDVRDMANIDSLALMPRLLRLLASRTGQLLNYSDVARGVGLAQTTLKRYMALLEGTFLVRTLAPWYRNIGKRFVKSPKILFCDTGLGASLLGMDDRRLAAEPIHAGPLLENFVAMELLKQAGWSTVRPALYHYRTHAQREVDVVLEDTAGRVVGIEIKCSGSVDASAFAGLRDLAESAGGQFQRGVVLYLGDTPVAFGNNMHALPLETLWKMGFTGGREA